MFREKLAWLYLGNAAVLITHEIDSAYWHEWELFAMPGGIQLFLVLNLLLAVLVLYGYRALLIGRRSGAVYSWALVAAGFAAVTVHGAILLRGDDAFRAPVSLGLLAATLVLSGIQGALLSRGHLRRSSI